MLIALATYFAKNSADKIWKAIAIAKVKLRTIPTFTSVRIGKAWLVRFMAK